MFFDWAEEKMQKNKRKRLETELKMKYPPPKIGKTFDLIQSTAKPGMIYLLDLETGKKHHIASLSTFVSLGYDHSMVKNKGQAVFNQYEEGDEFLTEGERYS